MHQLEMLVGYSTTAVAITTAITSLLDLHSLPNLQILPKARSVDSNGPNPRTQQANHIIPPQRRNSLPLSYSAKHLH